MAESESESPYNWRPKANQFTLATSPLRLTNSNFFQLNTCGHCPYVTSSLMRGWVCRLQMLLALASGHSQIRVQKDSWPNFAVSDSSFPQPGGPGPRIYIPQEQGGPVISQAPGFLFVVSYDSHCYGGGIRARLHTVMTVGPRYIQPPQGRHREHRLQDFLNCWVRVCCSDHMTATEPLPRNGRVCRAVPLQSLSLLASRF
jgi:hypothetical protein